MELPGHVGIALLAFLPVAYLLVARDRRRLWGGLAVLLAAAVTPDVDLYVAEVVHRGPTHTVWAAVAVGWVLALSLSLASWRRRDVDGRILTRARTSSSGIADDPSLATGGCWSWVDSLTASGRWSGYVPAVGVLGVTSHLLGDVLTPMGIRPFAPLVPTTYTLSLTPAADPMANATLLTVGVGSFAAALALGRRQDSGTPAGEHARYGDGVARLDRNEA